MYSADLAAFHDANESDLAREAATTLVDELAEATLTRGTVADIGCGSGVLAALMGEAGYDVLAIDPSPAFLALVARRAPRATTQLATAASMQLPRGLVAIVAVGEALSHDMQIDLEETVERLYASLRPGGVLLLDLPGPGRHGGPRTTSIRDTEHGVLATVTEEQGFRLQRSVTLFTEMTDGSYRRHDEVHELRLYDPADIRTALSRAGFVAIRPLERYGAHGPAFHDGWAGFSAEKP